jgi:hypothetical protein
MIGINARSDTGDSPSEQGRPGQPADGFDEITSGEASAEADFAPLPEPGKAPAAVKRDADPFQSDSIRAQESFDAAVARAAAGDEEGAIQEYIRASKIAETAHEWYLSAVACERVGDFLLHPAPPSDMDRAFRMYRRAIAAYEQCGLFAEARELAYRQMFLRMARSGELRLPLKQRLELFIYWAIAGFGYRPQRVIGLAMSLVFAFAVLYWSLGGVVQAGNAGGQPVGFWPALYFSGITFATVGYGDFLPAPHVRVLALAEGAIGALTLGFFVAVLANRLSKA